MKSERKIIEDDNFAAFTPFASRFPFEVWIMPKRHATGINEMTDEEKHSFAKILKEILMKLNTMLNAPPYNTLFHFAVVDDDLHFHVEICLRLSKWVGFELGAGIVINTMSSEDAEEFYRD